jgi:hypothetical protein
VGSRMNSEGCWIAVEGSKGAGVKLSWGSAVGVCVGADFRPVSVSQLWRFVSTFGG